jgi:hypothetical protein
MALAKELKKGLSGNMKLIPGPVRRKQNFQKKSSNLYKISLIISFSVQFKRVSTYSN